MTGSSDRSAKVSGVGVLVAILRRGPAQQRPQPREQLLEGERLGQVVVGARVEPGDPVGDGLARGEDEHRQVVPGAAQPPAHLEPVEPRHHDVEDEGVGAVTAGDRVQGLLAVGGELDLVPVERQGPAQGVAHGPVVVDDEDPHARSLDSLP